MVTRLVTDWTLSSGTRGRGGTLTVCLLVNLSFGGGWEVTERRGGVWELWRRGRGGARISERADHVKLN